MNAIILAFRSDKSIKQYLEQEDPAPNYDDMDCIPQKYPNSYPAKNTIKDLLAQEGFEGEEKQTKINTNLIGKEDSKDMPITGDIGNFEENKLKDEEENTRKRTFINKLFGPMEDGSIRGSIFNMVILSLGSGCLSLPKYIGKTSLLMSIVLIVAIGLLAWWALSLISKACYKKQIFIYCNLIEALYGKTLARIYDAIVILYSIGVLILYQVISKCII